LKYVKVGKLNKAFGIKGQMRVVVTKAFESDLRSADVWFIEKGGEVVPYFVDGLEDAASLLVKFEDIDSPESTKKLSGGAILLRAGDVTVNEDPEEDSTLDKLVGFEVHTQEFLIGEITSIEEYPQQMMAFIRLADADDVIMIPLNPEFIVDIDVQERIVEMDLPEGMVDVQLD